MRRILFVSMVVLALLPASVTAQGRTAAIELSPSAVDEGERVTTTGSGFQPGTVELFLDTVGGSPLASAVADAGIFTTRFNAPRGVPGRHSVIACRDRARDDSCRETARATLTIAPPATTTTSTTTSSTTTTTTTSTSTTTSSPPPSTAVVTTTTTEGSGDLAATTVPPTIPAPSDLATSTTVGGFPGSTTSLGAGDFGVESTTTMPTEGVASEIGDIQLRAIEVTQGLQNLDNDFPLLAGRPTWVRVHATTDADAGMQTNVQAALLVLRNGVEMGVRWAENGPVTLPAELSPGTRRTHTGTPYFELPPDWTDATGDLELRVMVFANGDTDASNEADATNNSGAVVVDLQQARPVTIHYFPLWLEDDAGQPLIHTPQMGFIAEHMTTYRIWPVSDLYAVPHLTVVGDEDSDWDLSSDQTYAAPNLALAELYADSGLGDDHIYVGMVHEDVETGTVSGLAGAGTTWSKMGGDFGDDGRPPWGHRYGETVAHEGGHFAGLPHAPCKYNPDDPVPQEAHGGAYDATFPASYSWPNCSLAPTDWTGYYGFDPVPSLPGTPEPAILSNDPDAPASSRAFPWMGYQAPHWTDPYHGCAMLTFLDVACDFDTVIPIDPSQGNGGHVPSGASGGVPVFTCDMGLPGEDIDFCDLQLGPSGDPTAAPAHDAQLLISGVIDAEAGVFDLARAVEVTSMGDLDGTVSGDPTDDGPYVVALVDGQGTATWATTIDVDDSASHGATERGATTFNVRFPRLASTERIVLARPTDVLDELASSAAPTVEITEARVDESGLHLAVATADADGDELRTSASYRPSPDASWVPLVAGSSRTSFVFDDLRDLPGSTDGELRVRVSDGFSTATADRGGLVVPDQAPRLSVLRPVDGSSARSTSAVALTAHAFDADAGDDPAASAYVWESDRDGRLAATGIAVVRGLSVGRHQLTVTATDGAGNTTSATVTLDVIAGTPVDPAVTEAVAERLRSGPTELVSGPTGAATTATDNPSGDPDGGSGLPLVVGGVVAALGLAAAGGSRVRRDHHVT